jgi:eukaryotic-like serine/threonine-protein kinase
MDFEAQSVLRAALTHAPDLPEAHAGLAERYRGDHAVAEETRDARETPRAEALLRRHTSALPPDDAVRQSSAAYLQGDGTLTLQTDPPGAEVLLHRYEIHNRRLVPIFERSLGHTPLRAVPLAKGSYLCLLRRPGHLDVRYPVHIGRQEHWDAVNPHTRDPEPVWMPDASRLGPTDCYVPAGWFRSGGDPDARDSLPQCRLWADGHVFRRFPVTNRDYIAFLDDLVTQGRAHEAHRHAPRQRTGAVDGTGSDPSPGIYGFEGGRFHLRPDAEGDVWLADWPVIMVDWYGARAFAAWEAARTGMPWALPGELAWEKAARGVDGRFHPWGDWLDPSWCCMRDSHPAQPLPAVIDSFPVDTSPYGIRGMVGNAREWCAGVYAMGGPAVEDRVVAAVADPGESPAGRAVRGGSWGSRARFVRVAYRGWHPPEARNADLGFRLARRIGPAIGASGPTPHR